MGAGTALLWALLASALVPVAGADIAAEGGSPWRTSLCLLAVTATALWWVPEPLGSPVYLVLVSATAPCAAAVLLAHHHFRAPSPPPQAAPAADERCPSAIR